MNERRIHYVNEGGFTLMKQLPASSFSARFGYPDEERVRRASAAQEEEWKKLREAWVTAYIAAAVAFGLAIADRLPDFFNWRTARTIAISGHRMRVTERAEAMAALEGVLDQVADDLRESIRALPREDWLRACRWFRVPEITLPGPLARVSEETVNQFVKLLKEHGFGGEQNNFGQPLTSAAAHPIFDLSRWPEPAEVEVEVPLSDGVTVSHRRVRPEKPLLPFWRAVSGAALQVSHLDLESVSKGRVSVV